MPPFYKKIRFWYRFLAAIVKKYYWVIFIGAIAGILSFFLVPKLLALFPKNRDTRSIAIIGRFSLSEIPLSIQQKISLGLTTLTLDGQPAPALAKSWSISDDGKTYSFILNTNYKWHDGQALSSRDIDYHFHDASIETPMPNQLIIKLSQPFSPLPVALSRPLFKIKNSNFLFFFPNSQLLGLGTYKVSQLIKNGQTIESLTLEPTDIASQLPKLKYIFYPTQSLALTAFKLGLVRTIEDFPRSAQVSSWANIRTQTLVHKDRYVGLFFNTGTQLFGGTAGKNLRLALAYAIDKSRWPNRCIGPISPTSWVFNPDVKSYDQDIPKAKQIISKLDKITDKITISASPDNLDVAESIKSDWEAVGIHSEVVTTLDYSANFSVLLLTQAIPTDPDQYNLWHSTQTTNSTRLDSKRIDKLLEDGRSTVDPGKRREIYIEFQKYLVEELPAVFLFHPVSYTISR